MPIGSHGFSASKLSKENALIVRLQQLLSLINSKKSIHIEGLTWVWEVVVNISWRDNVMLTSSRSYFSIQTQYKSNIWR